MWSSDGFKRHPSSNLLVGEVLMNGSCHTWLTLRHGSFFEKSKLDLQKWLHIFLTNGQSIDANCGNYSSQSEMYN